MPLATRTINGNNGGPFAVRPKVVIMHATRSTIASKTDAEELKSTLNHFVGPSGASSHFALSEIERARVVADDLMAGHASYLNDRAWGVELTQPAADRPFTDGHYANAALVGRHYVSLGVAPVWLPYWDGNTDESGFVGHEDTIQGRAVGKSDPGQEFDTVRFIASLQEDDMKFPVYKAIGGDGRRWLIDPATLTKRLIDQLQFDVLNGQGYIEEFDVLQVQLDSMQPPVASGEGVTLAEIKALRFKVA